MSQDDDLSTWRFSGSEKFVARTAIVEDEAKGL